IILKYIKPAAPIYYNSIIRPILESTPTLLYQISNSDSERLEKSQNRALKIISGVRFNKPENTNLSKIREDLNIPLLSTRRLFFYINSVYKSHYHRSLTKFSPP